jgi:hypothetical protein
LKPVIKIVLLSVLLTGAKHCGYAETKDLHAAVDLVLKAEQLDDAAIGIAGVRTQVYDAFSQLYKAGKASTDSAKVLIASATPAGRIYGYLIFRRVSPADADSVVKQMMLDQADVEVLNGCIVSHSTVSEIVARIQKGEMVIRLPQ